VWRQQYVLSSSPTATAASKGSFGGVNPHAASHPPLECGILSYRCVLPTQSTVREARTPRHGSCRFPWGGV